MTSRPPTVFWTGAGAGRRHPAYMVREVRFELTRLCGPQGLNLVRLPVPAHAHVATPAGFEPGIADLRGLRPGLLDEGALWQLRRGSNPRPPDRQSGVIANFTTELYRGTGSWI